MHTSCNKKTDFVALELWFVVQRFVHFNSSFFEFLVLAKRQVAPMIVPIMIVPVFLKTFVYVAPLDKLIAIFLNPWFRLFTPSFERELCGIAEDMQSFLVSFLRAFPVLVSLRLAEFCWSSHGTTLFQTIFISNKTNLKKTFNYK